MQQGSEACPESGFPVIQKIEAASVFLALCFLSLCKIVWVHLGGVQNADHPSFNFLLVGRKQMEEIQWRASNEEKQLFLISCSIKFQK